MRRREKNIYRDSRKQRRMRMQRNLILFLLLCVIVALCFIIFHKNAYEKGISDLKKKEYKEAAIHFQDAVKKEIRLDQAYRGLGISYFEMGAYDKAVVAFESAIEEGTEKTDTLCNLLGSCYMQTEQYDKAIAVFEEGIALKECEPVLEHDMRYNQIIAYEKIGSWENAKACMVEFLVKYPDDADAKREADFLGTR